MSKRELYYSQIALLIIGVPILISMPVFWPVYYFVAYLLTSIYCGEAVAEFEPLYYGFTVAFAMFSIVIPALSFWFRKHGSDRAYLVVRKLCNVILTFFATIAAFLTCLFVCGEPFFMAWQWCENYGEIPFAMLLFLVPIFFVFFLKIRFRVPRHVGNTALAVSLWTIARVAIPLFDDDNTWQNLCICGVAFVFLWIFEQVQRDKDGKLNVFTRAILTAISSLASFVTAKEAVRFACNMIAGGFSWAWLNSLLFAVPVFALFIAYAVKINKVKK